VKHEVQSTLRSRRKAAGGGHVCRGLASSKSTVREED